MIRIQQSGRGNRHLTTIAILFGCVVLAGVVSVAFVSAWEAKPDVPVLNSQAEMMHLRALGYPPDVRQSGPNTLFEIPGIRQPLSFLARAVSVPGNTEVIGVTMAGKHRAYVRLAFHELGRHIVNDLVGPTPVSVTYCDRTDQVRVFTGKAPGKPLNISLGGWHDDLRRTHAIPCAASASGRVDIGPQKARGSMLLKVRDQRYLHDAVQPLEPKTGKPFPHQQVAFTRTTWQAWNQAHPDTDIYIGKLTYPLR